MQFLLLNKISEEDILSLNPQQLLTEEHLLIILIKKLSIYNLTK